MIAVSKSRRKTSERLLCLLGRRRWIRMNGVRLTFLQDQPVERVCSRCGLTE